MFCPLKGATRQPRRLKMRQSAATNMDFPAWDVVPTTIIDFTNCSPSRVQNSVIQNSIA
ncbi:MAG: hypothetical protein AAF171_22760 [Cyanobacteria bacterium P01_A01_bin.116]